MATGAYPDDRDRPPLKVSICPTASSATFVTVGSADPSTVAISGGGTTVLTGEKQAAVLVDALQTSATGVLVTAQLGAFAFDATIRVLPAGSFLDGFETGDATAWSYPEPPPAVTRESQEPKAADAALAGC